MNTFRMFRNHREMKSELTIADMCLFLIFCLLYMYVDFAFALDPYIGKTAHLGNGLQSGLNANETGLPIMNSNQRRAANDFIIDDPSDEFYDRMPKDIKKAYDRLVNLYTNDTKLGTLATVLSDVCPEWLPCLNTRQLYNLDQSGMGCCMRCHCDEFCSSIRSCCPGFEPNTTTKEVVEKVESNLQTRCINAAFFTRDANVLRNAPEYTMVTDCPTDTPLHLKHKCTALLPSNNDTESESIHAFADIIPVTDDVTKTTYMNKHCAACNGVSRESQIVWKAKYSCRSYSIDLTNPGMVEQIIQSEQLCYLVLIPPDHVIANTTRCYNDVVERCNVTGRWKTHDHVIEELCNTTEWLYEVPGRNKRYKNIFCALCNGEESTYSFCPANIADNIRSAFSAVLNFNPDLKAPADISSGPSGSGCPLGQLFDPVRVLCQIVACSFPLTLNHVTRGCVALYESVTYGLAEVSLVQVLVNPVYTDYTQTIMAGLYSVMYDLTFHFECTFYNVFLKLNISYSTLIHKGSIESEKILAVYTMALVNLRDFEGGHSQIKDEFLNTSILVLDESIYFELNTHDPYFLPPTLVNNNTDKGTREGEPIKMRVGPEGLLKQYTVYEDPYDGAAVLHTGSQSDVADIPCDPMFLLYDRHHFECPSFVYDTQRVRVIRMAQGILLEDHNVAIPFGKFKSLNSTHVAVCVDALQEMSFEAKSSASNPYRLFHLTINLVWMAVASV